MKIHTYEELYERNASNFFRKYNCNNNNIYIDRSHIFAIMWLFSHKASVIFNTFFAIVHCDTEYQRCKIPYLEFEAHHENFVSVRCICKKGST
jgi:hypothetical protein